MNKIALVSVLPVLIGTGTGVTVNESTSISLGMFIAGVSASVVIALKIGRQAQQILTELKFLKELILSRPCLDPKLGKEDSKCKVLDF